MLGQPAGHAASVRPDATIPGTPMISNNLIEQALFLAYRWSSFMVLNVIDDAAILALVFC